MRGIAVIPARMGSNRMPWKNRLEIEVGVSLAQHAVNCARGAGCFERIVVSTDAPEDLPIDRAIVSRRPPDLATGTSDIAAVVQHELALAERMGGKYGLVAVLQPAVLARSPLIVKRLVDEVARTGARGGLTMCPVHPWVWTAHGDQISAPWLPGPYPRSQDCGKMWQEINAVQVTTAEVVRCGGRWDFPLVVMDLPAWSAVLDVDTPADLEAARDIWPYARRKLETWTGDMRLCYSKTMETDTRG